MDSDCTQSPLDWDWTLKSGLQSSVGPVDWTGLDIAPANLAWQEGHWNPVESTGVQWSPLESSGVHMDYVGEGKDLVNVIDFLAVPD